MLLKASWSQLNNLFLFSTSDNLFLVSFNWDEDNDSLSLNSFNWDEHIDSLSLASFNWDVNDVIFSTNSVTVAGTGTAKLEVTVGGICLYMYT